MLIAKEKLKSIAGKAVVSPQAVKDAINSILEMETEIDRDREHFWTLGLTTRNTVKYIDLVSLGTLNATLVHPREVFRTAIANGVASLVLSHNHPSGDPAPSEEDRRLTKQLIEGGKILGIDVLDHVVVGGTGHYSFQENRDI